MNNKILPVAVLGGLIAFGGAFLAVRSNSPSSRLPRTIGGEPVATRAGPRPAPDVPASGDAGSDDTAPGLPVVSADPAVHRAVAEVFPGCVPPADDWRHGHPAILRVAPYPEKAVTFRQVRVKEEGRYLTWIGRDPDLPGATYVGIATPGGYDAVMIVPGAGQYHFHVRAGLALVEETNATGGDCELGPPVPVAASLPVPAGLQFAEADGSGADATVGMTTAHPIAEAPPSVDVLFLYNTRALAVAAQRSADPIGYMDGYTRAGLETCNLVLQNSRVDTFVWRYAGLVALPAEYPQQVTVGDDLGMIAPGGQFDDFVRSVRAQYGADQVLMWTGAGTRQGAAYAGDVRSEAVPPEYAIAALRLTAGILILGHELAHNFGCQHDRGHAGSGDGSTATPDGDGLWCYGLLWNDPVGGTTSGTVMAYSDFLVPYFSNPDITLEITSTLENRSGAFLNLGTRTIGFPESDPRAANNARILREHGAYMAALSPETEAVPVLLQQPEDVAVASGQVMTLTVSAMGGGLSYQWFKDGVAIAGATTATYGKTFAATDAGGYTVRVSNGRGTVTSRTAAITLVVVAPAVPAPAPVVPAAAPAGGGGGGAPSEWFYLALLVAVASRIGRRRAPCGRGDMHRIL